MKLVIGFVAAATTLSTLSFAQTERDLDSHEHGNALLNIAIDDAMVIIELESPWNNFVGFEHSPRTTEQHALVDDVLAQLEQPDKLFLFSGAECVSSGVVIESAMDSGEDDHHEEEKGHSEEHDEHDKDAEHDEHVEEEQHDDHKEDEDHDEHEGESEAHSSLLASFSFECIDVSQLASIDVQVLERWTGFEELDVQLIGPSGQSLVELAPGQSLVDLAAVR